MERSENSYRQTLSFTIINYIGIAIGIFATLFLYPKNKQIIGLYRFVEGMAYILYPIFVMGSSQALVNFYPKLNVRLRNNLFVYSFYSIVVLSGIFFLGLLLLSYIPFVSKISTLYFACGIAFFMACIELFKKKASIVSKLTIPTLFDTLLPRIALPILFVLICNKTITIYESMYFYVFSFFLVFVFIFIYLRSYFTDFLKFNFQKLFSTISKSDYYSFSLFAFAGSLGTIFAFRIDSIMIPLFLSMEDNGSFGIAVSLVSAIAIPANGLFAIYSPIISNHLNSGNFEELNKKYKEISIFLFFIGVLIYSCLFLGIENLFQLLPTAKNLVSSIPVILVLGFTILINMGTGFNSEIITYSNQFRFNLIAILILVVSNVSLNFLFLGYYQFGIQGVAYASLISTALFNLVKLIFIYKKFRLFPFDYKYLLLVITSVSVIAFVRFIPETISPFFNLASKTTLCLILNLVLVYRLNLVLQFNVLMNSFFAKFRK